ncbi:hypothetical protein ACFL3V_05685 [Nanoarchaeota archaeon]
MTVTTIKIRTDTKKALDKYREYRNESYDEVIKKMLHIVKNVKRKPQLSKWAIKQIEEARERMSKGEYVTLEELEKKFGM